MAMALEDAQVPAACYRIDAIDLSDVALARARAGLYTRNAFRGAQLDFRERHFVPNGLQYQIDPLLQRQITFSKANILSYDPGLRYDVIFCRNLLIYFDEPTVAAAIARLDALLLDDGMLFAGYAEVPAFTRYGFELVRAPGAFALRKRGATTARHPPPAPAPHSSAPTHTPRKRVAGAPASVPASVPIAAPATAARAGAKAAPKPPTPADNEALLEQARRLADQGDLAGASSLCSTSLAADGALADAWFLLGLCSELAGDPGAADLDYRRCVYLRPDHYEALCHLALLCEQAGKTAQASAFRQRAARIYGRRADDTTGESA
jgi:chemotaxis protein methyltransferase WspC